MNEARQYFSEALGEINYRAGGDAPRKAYFRWKKAKATEKHSVVSFVAGWNAARDANESVLGEAEAQPRGKAQVALMAYLETPWAAGGPDPRGEKLNDVLRNYRFQGMHSGKVSKAAHVLAKKGLVHYDGLNISLLISGA